MSSLSYMISNNLGINRMAEASPTSVGSRRRARVAAISTCRYFLLYAGVKFSNGLVYLQEGTLMIDITMGTFSQND